jgi:hypothetical protein
MRAPVETWIKPRSSVAVANQAFIAIVELKTVSARSV